MKNDMGNVSLNNNQILFFVGGDENQRNRIGRTLSKEEDGRENKVSKMSFLSYTFYPKQ